MSCWHGTKESKGTTWKRLIPHMSFIAKCRCEHKLLRILCNLELGEACAVDRRQPRIPLLPSTSIRCLSCPAWRC